MNVGYLFQCKLLAILIGEYDHFSLTKSGQFVGLRSDSTKIQLGVEQMKKVPSQLRRKWRDYCCGEGVRARKRRAAPCHLMVCYAYGATVGFAGMAPAFGRFTPISSFSSDGHPTGNSSRGGLYYTGQEISLLQLYCIFFYSVVILKQVSTFKTEASA